MQSKTVDIDIKQHKKVSTSTTKETVTNSNPSEQLPITSVKNCIQHFKLSMKMIENTVRNDYGLLHRRRPMP